MARVTIEDCLQHAGSKFELIHGAVKRAAQLKKGAPPLVDTQGEKDTVIALREIAAGKVTLIKRKPHPTPIEKNHQN